MRTAAVPAPTKRKPTWSREQIRAARCRPLKPLLEQLGYPLNPLGDDNYLVMRLPGDIVVKQGYWRSVDTGDGGNAIDLLVKIVGKDFHEAMKLLLEHVH